METDKEISGDGNSYTTQFRQYDPRLGRWKSLDPMMFKFPAESPYSAFVNNPIVYTDPLGLEPNKDGKPKENGKTKRFKKKVKKFADLAGVDEYKIVISEEGNAKIHYKTPDGEWGIMFLDKSLVKAEIAALKKERQSGLSFSDVKTVATVIYDESSFGKFDKFMKANENVGSVDALRGNTKRGWLFKNGDNSGLVKTGWQYTIEGDDGVGSPIKSEVTASWGDYEDEGVYEDADYMPGANMGGKAKPKYNLKTVKVTIKVTYKGNTTTKTSWLSAKNAGAFSPDKIKSTTKWPKHLVSSVKKGLGVIDYIDDHTETLPRAEPIQPILTVPHESGTYMFYDGEWWHRQGCISCSDNDSTYIKVHDATTVPTEVQNKANQ